MTDAPDAVLLEQFARNDSEEAFSEIVRRHIGLVHSVARRQTQNAQYAEEITQAVFIILARKAASLGNKTVLSGWLYHTARLTTANFQRAEVRRAHREQNAFMQPQAHDEQIESAWQDMGPLLEEAMAKLKSTDRDAIVLRFFENKSLREVGTAMGMEERAAQKRVARSLEKLRAFFTKRGLVLSTALIAGAVSANSVKAASPALAASVKAVAFAKGSAAGASTLTLVKGALKIMAWTKAKIVIAATAGILVVAGTATVAIEKTIERSSEVLEQQLPDGSTLVLNRVSFGDKNAFTHDGKTRNFDSSWPGYGYLVAEFKLISNTPDEPLLRPAFYRQFRCIVHGESGIDFVEEFEGNTQNGGFQHSADGDFAYIDTSIFPRDSRQLWFRIEKSETNKPYGPWEKVAEFKINNPASAQPASWIPAQLPSANTVGGMQFVVDDLTVDPHGANPRDIWNHSAKLSTQVLVDGAPLTNWGATYVKCEDASGNWNPIFQSHRSLDPRYVWKLEMNFEPEFGFGETNLASIHLPVKGPFTTTTDIMGVPVTVSWDGRWINASMPTNRTDLALKLVGVTDAQGREGVMPSGSWDQHFFRRGSFMWRLPNGNVNTDFTPETLTMAVVPNVHTTFYVQPKLLSDDTAKSPAAP